MIKLINVEKRYHAVNNSVLALDCVSLEIVSGSIFGVIGESGAGKTSLLRCMNLLERPDSGQVIVAGSNLTTLSAKELRETRRRIGMIFQHFNLLSTRTVYQNIALPLTLTKTPKHEIATRVVPLIELTGLTGKEQSYPHELSGGQKQRVAIARALVTQPDVLLCDEATASLDPKTTTSILSLLAQINRRTGLTIVLITHELDVLQAICDRMAVMAGGKIIETTTVDDFFQSHAQRGESC